MHSLEKLESRIAPAALLGKVLTYADIDGDKVTVTFTKGAPAAANFVFDNSGVDGHTMIHQQLELIDLHGDGTSPFLGTAIKVRVTREPGGDGLAAIGRIDATGVSLGKVSIAGDLGAVSAGSNVAGVPAMAGLSVNSMGRYGLRTQAAGGTFESDINGGLGSLVVRHDVAGVFLKVTGSIGPVTIGQSLIGGSATSSGEIMASVNIGPVKIGADIAGGTGSQSGYLFSGLDMTSLTVGGSLLGGTGNSTGTVEVTRNLGAATIGHDVIGAAGVESGYLESDFGNLKSVRIGGSLIGGTGQESGCAIANGSGVFGNIGSIYIGHDIVGGGGVNGTGGSVSGYAVAQGKIGGVYVGGSVLGGTTSRTGGISSNGTLGAVVIGHDLIGGEGPLSGYIRAFGSIKSVNVGGSVVGGSASSTGEILTMGFQAGVEENMGPVRIGHNLVGGGISGTQGNLTHSGYIGSNGQIASVTIGGSVISGVDDSTGGSLDGSGSIRAAYDIPLLRVSGSLIGHHTANGDSPVVISAQGQESVPAGATADRAFGSITVGHRVEWTEILAGYNTNLAAADGNAQVGAVTVGGDWIASSLAAGVQNSNGPTHFGQSAGTNDAIIPPATTTNSIARIAGITVAGSVIGDATATNGTDQFAFISERIHALSVHGAKASFTFPNLSPLTGDVTVRQLLTN